MQLFSKYILSTFIISALFGVVSFYSTPPVEAQTGCALADPSVTCAELTNPSTDLCPPGCSASECAQIYSRATGCSINGGQEGANKPLAVIVGDLVRALFGFLGVAFLLLIIYGGFVWMTAGGNEDSVGRAKRIITQATIGLIVIVVAFAISNFIFNSILSATATN